jgi:hypothetical protein
VAPREEVAELQNVKVDAVADVVKQVTAAIDEQLEVASTSLKNATTS